MAKCPDLDCPRLLLLVHGFANDEEEAHASYVAARLRSWPVPLPEIDLPEEELGSVDITGPRHPAERHEASRG